MHGRGICYYFSLLVSLLFFVIYLFFKNLFSSEKITVYDSFYYLKKYIYFFLIETEFFF